MTPEKRIEAAKLELVQARTEIARTLRTERSRRRAPLNRQFHEVTRMLMPGDPYSSQAGQDRIVDSLLAGKTGGTFADIGGYDGVTGSNTLFFERHRGWTGLLVEPVAAQLERARVARSCACVGCAVSAEAGEAEFIEVREGFRQMSGLAASYDPDILAEVRKDSRHKEETVTVETRTLSDILTEGGVPDPDYVSLDIEGGELPVLESFPFDKHDVTAWSIENTRGLPRVAEIMRDNGYSLADFCGPDEIYLKRQSR
ncbi:FkbM family methyltransferase [Histidinibacterium aquaticum]|uniref:FkbM family methyltransferase n=1 Tax=Histidinibacterium aquaticum TaxID=2613962 RepID=A0A5J5GG83_9RHOB|nr:FkbM family methyltransferase [Histidinibacterium aquaticum]KAA9006733.1 FkbM family methyltransferase [Histidinibacterium aquaticum]